VGVIVFCHNLTFIFAIYIVKWIVPTYIITPSDFFFISDFL
jgi:hypothetical protein